ncbi:helix-turn-helix domain-containing protein [Geotoga petraea]|uniref:Helix-turn-helix domain-containing protein n=1 Tax=Geotoga petraea TaxID=28234 RepID=A0A1G6MM12_9BACT|nr:helix-turn-helix domain-containing protein [Geotoga petraea]SDC56267.1 Helix-turn-helix domain-containing protein [Geotoga petraea]
MGEKFENINELEDLLDDKKWLEKRKNKAENALLKLSDSLINNFELMNLEEKKSIRTKMKKVIELLEYLEQKEDEILDEEIDYDSKKYYTRQEAIEELDISLSTLIRWEKEGEIKPLESTKGKKGKKGKVLYPKKEIMKVKEIKK